MITLEKRQPKAFEAFAAKVLGLSDGLRRRWWMALLADEGVESQTLIYGMNSIVRADEPLQALGSVLQVQSPQRLVAVIERLVARRLLSRADGNVITEHVLQQTDRRGWWK
jgi:hypothetical protein